MALFQNKQTSEGAAFNGTELGSLQLNTLFTTASGVRYTDKEETPVSPDNPDVPDTPDEPDNPDQPDTPDNPDNPDQPDTPDTPDRPDNSGNSDQPNNSNNSDASDQPDASDQSDISDNPDNPNDSGTKNHTQAAQTSDAVMEYTAPLMLIALFSALVIRVSCARCRRAARTGISKQEWR